MNHNFNLSPFLQTFGILAPREVDVQGEPGTVNSLKVQCLTGKTLNEGQCGSWSVLSYGYIQLGNQLVSCGVIDVLIGHRFNVISAAA
jgi:hypothetical protein